MRPTTLRLLLLPAALLVMAERPASADLVLGNYNLIATGDLKGDNSDVQGRVLVGGTLSVNNFNFGGQLSYSSTPAGVFGTLDSKVTHLDNNGQNFAFGAGNSIGANINGSNVTVSATDASSYTNGLATQLANLSAGYAALATNSWVDTTDPNQIKFNASPTTINGHSVAVFSVNQSFFTGSGTVSQLNGVGANTTVIINVTGGTPGNDPLNFSSGLNFSAFSNAKDEANIIYNFENATALNGLNNLAGSILAPNADLNTTSSLVGSVYVKSVTNVGEIDLAMQNGTAMPGYSGFTPLVTVPEPSSLVLTALGGLGALAVARRRKARIA